MARLLAWKSEGDRRGGRSEEDERAPQEGFPEGRSDCRTRSAALAPRQRVDIHRISDGSKHPRGGVELQVGDAICKRSPCNCSLESIQKGNHIPFILPFKGISPPLGFSVGERCYLATHRYSACECDGEVHHHLQGTLNLCTSYTLTPLPQT